MPDCIVTPPARGSLRAFECTVAGTDWATTVHHVSAGKAKAQYFRHVREAWQDTPYTAIRCRVLGAPRDSEAFRHTATSRGLPDAHIGQRVRVGDSEGWIVDRNDSANFNVLFYTGRYTGGTLNCHPHCDGFTFIDDPPPLARDEMNRGAGEREKEGKRE